MIPAHPPAFRSFVSRSPCRKHFRLELALLHDSAASARVSFLRFASPCRNQAVRLTLASPHDSTPSRPFRSFAAPYLASQARSTRALFAPRLCCTRARFVPSLRHRSHRKHVHFVVSPHDGSKLFRCASSAFTEAPRDFIRRCQVRSSTPHKNPRLTIPYPFPEGWGLDLWGVVVVVVARNCLRGDFWGCGNFCWGNRWALALTRLCKFAVGELE